MVATTDPRKRFFDLLACMMELVRDGKRTLEEVCDVLQVIKDGKKGKAVEIASADVGRQLASWQDFYHEIWGINPPAGGSDLRIPDQKDDLNWLIVMLEGMTPEKIVRKMREYMKVRVWDERWLKEVTSVRKTNRDYAIWVRDRIEADEELKNLSADTLEVDDINCITLEERLMLEFFYWWKTKKHLDIKNVTLCAGSCNSDGSVPSVDWHGDGGEVDVGWYASDCRHEYLRARRAVS